MKTFLLLTLLMTTMIGETLAAIDFEQDLFNLFLKSSPYLALREKAKAEWYVHQDVLRKSELSLSSRAYRKKAKDLATSELNLLGRYEKEDTLLNMTAEYRFKNSPILSSLALAASVDFHKYGYQTIDSSYKPQSYDAKEFGLTLSYDLAKGGKNDFTYINSRIEKNIKARSYFENLNQLKANYISFLRQALTLTVVNCQNKNLENSLKAIENTLQIAEIGSQVGTYSYKDLLNVRSLKNIVENRKLLAEVNYQTNLQKISLYGEEAQSFLTKTLIDDKFCQTFLGQRANNSNQVVELDRANKVFFKTLPSKILNHSISESRNKLNLTQVNRRPAVRPYVKNTAANENILGVEEKKIEVGITMDWDVPFAYSFATTRSEIATLNSLQTQMKLTETNYYNDVKNLNSRSNFLLKLIANVKKTVEINDEILKILSTQRSIGKTDSLTLTNAFLNKNESLNQLYESNSEIILNNAQYFYEISWKLFLKDSSKSAL